MLTAYVQTGVNNGEIAASKVVDVRLRAMLTAHVQNNGLSSGGVRCVTDAASRIPTMTVDSLRRAVPVDAVLLTGKSTVSSGAVRTVVFRKTVPSEVSVRHRKGIVFQAITQIAKMPKNVLRTGCVRGMGETVVWPATTKTVGSLKPAQRKVNAWCYAIDASHPESEQSGIPERYRHRMYALDGMSRTEHFLPNLGEAGYAALRGCGEPSKGY